MSESNCTGRNLRDLRKAAGMTQQGFVDALSERGISMQVCTLCKLERGTRRITDYELKAFADVLGVSVSKLFENVSLCPLQGAL